MIDIPKAASLDRLLEVGIKVLEQILDDLAEKRTVRKEALDPRSDHGSRWISGGIVPRHGVFLPGRWRIENLSGVLLVCLKPFRHEHPCQWLPLENITSLLDMPQSHADNIVLKRRKQAQAKQRIGAPVVEDVDDQWLHRRGSYGDEGDEGDDSPLGEGEGGPGT